MYESNLQLGGPEVMGGNGVAHLLVDSDVEAVASMVKWVSFVPCAIGAPLPPAVLACLDELHLSGQVCEVGVIDDQHMASPAGT